MKKINFSKLPLVLLLSLTLVGCSQTESNHSNTTPEEENTSESTSQDSASTDSITVTDAHGELTLSSQPKRVVSLDRGSLETLEEWGIDLLAAPQDMSHATDSSITDNDSSQELDLEALAATDPDLVIVGQEFASYYDDIKSHLPDAAVLDLSMASPEEGSNQGDMLLANLTDKTLTLGEVFQKQAEAEQLILDFEDALAQASQAYDPSAKVMGLVLDQGKLTHSAPGSGAFWGPLFDIFQWQAALESEGKQTEEISTETIAQAHPDWLLVLDLADDSQSDEENDSAKAFIEGSSDLQSTQALSKGQVVYAPAQAYKNPSIQNYTHLFQSLADAFAV